MRPHLFEMQRVASAHTSPHGHSHEIRTYSKRERPDGNTAVDIVCDPAPPVGATRNPRCTQPVIIIMFFVYAIYRSVRHKGSRLIVCCCLVSHFEGSCTVCFFCVFSLHRKHIPWVQNSRYILLTPDRQRRGVSLRTVVPYRAEFRAHIYLSCSCLCIVRRWASWT